MHQKPPPRIPVVVVFGSGVCLPGTPAYGAAYELGAAIARAGWVLCNGGYAGTMEAAGRGASDAGGQTIGVTCRVFGRAGPNPYITREISTESLLARLGALVEQGDAFVILPGGTGTLLELALVWELVNKSLLGRTRPIILLGEHWTPVFEPVFCEQPDSFRPAVAPDVAGVIRILRESFG